MVFRLMVSNCAATCGEICPRIIYRLWLRGYTILNRRARGVDGFVEMSIYPDYHGGSAALEQT